MAKKVAVLGMCIALAMVLGWLESLVPYVMPVPGIRLGLANVVTMFLLYRAGWKEAAIVTILRVLLSSLLFGNLLVLLYSASGAAVSLLIMALLKAADAFSVVPISIVGGITHNLAQLLVAMLVLENGILFYYLPVLMIVGAISGVVIGLLGAFLIKHIPTELI